LSGAPPDRPSNQEEGMVRKFVVAASLTSMLAFGAQAQTPAVTTIVAPYAAGGTADLVSREFAEKLRPLLGSVVVENRAGANGGVGASYVAKSPPDGSKLLLSNLAVIVINPHLYKNLAYDPLNDLVPVARVTVSASALFIRNDHPANNVKELVAWSRAQNRPLRFGSAGVGGTTHIYIELFRNATGAETLHVPYKGIAPASVDVLGGQIDGQFSDIAPLMQYVKGGRMKMIGIIGKQRNPTVPDVPSFAEQGYPALDGVSWYGIFAPAKTPPATIDRIADAVSTTLTDQAFVQRLAQVGMAASYLGPAEFAKLVRSDLDWWGKVVADYKIKSE
jgi:tripartite-type tricarboxylate transporter receptor subunit TctC